ncbi:MAG: DNA starvation/stationary phase protection protein [Cyclobacteriaceae bacterium]|nr:DNA starvation/stationary phase protection protein [Cyclobacteriaceae bacterium]
MNATKESERKIPGYSREEINNVVNAMNLLLANYHVHYQKLRNYHWNVKGGDFFDIHEQFEIQYNTAKSNIDEIAERIRVFKSTPLSMLREYLEFSEIKETGTDLSADEMVREILNDYEILLKHMDAIVKIAAKNDDSGTEDLIKSFIKDLEKHHWMLTAFSA